MVNSNTNIYKMKREIITFSKKFSSKLSAPDKKFFADMTYGILSSQSCLLTKISHALQEKEKKIYTVDRLSEHLKGGKEYKRGLIIIIALEIIPCPLCGGELFTRGTCHRKAINSAGNTDRYQLRVLQCRECGTTHRELPAPLVPYKRYDGEAITHIVEQPESAPCNNHTFALILNWLNLNIPVRRSRLSGVI